MYECEFTIRITHKKTRQQTTTNKGNPMTQATHNATTADYPITQDKGVRFD
jgi:hypothetical protein